VYHCFAFETIFIGPRYTPSIAHTWARSASILAFPKAWRALFFATELAKTRTHGELSNSRHSSLDHETRQQATFEHFIRATDTFLTGSCRARDAPCSSSYSYRLQLVATTCNTKHECARAKSQRCLSRPRSECVNLGPPQLNNDRRRGINPAGAMTATRSRIPCSEPHVLVLLLMACNHCTCSIDRGTIPSQRRC
jgi:hypothetical protein